MAEALRPAPPTRARGVNSWQATAAGLVLLMLGLILGLAGAALLVLMAAGASLVPDAEPAVNAGQALFAALAVAVIVLGPAAIHLAAAVGVLSHRSWGRLLGMVTAWLGMVFGFVVLIARVNAQPLLPALVPAVALVAAYGFTFVVLQPRAGEFPERTSAPRSTR